VEAAQPEQSSSTTLGDVLYADKSQACEPEQVWVALVRCVAAGDQPALHALYERAHRPVYTLIARITQNRETAEELTLDVFHDVWRRASAYDPKNGTVLGWIMNQARSRAIDRLRYERRKKRAWDAPDSEVVDTTEFLDALERAQASEAVRHALGTLSAGEREAIEAAFFSEFSYAEVAARLDLPLGTVKTRIRSGLQKLRAALKS
jgi:RNA polymerase sigma-70 factor (ECF subfamily)